ncbi:MAG: hypothetical protein ACSLEM_04535 [Candidatus Malihini olakiniferum]
MPILATGICALYSGWLQNRPGEYRDILLGITIIAVECLVRFAWETRVRLLVSAIIGWMRITLIQAEEYLHPSRCWYGAKHRLRVSQIHKTTSIVQRHIGVQYQSLMLLFGIGIGLHAGTCLAAAVLQATLVKLYAE